MTETAEQIAKALSEKAIAANVGELRCSWCAYDAYPSEIVVVQRLVEHCLYEHGSHVPITAVTFTEFESGWELGRRAGAPALTNAEEAWRAAK